MNYLILSNIYSIINDENDELCENNHLENIQVDNYEDLEKKLIDHGYDFTPNEILIDVKIGNNGNNGNNVEEALAKPNSLVLTSDNKKISYSETYFLIKWFCDKKAVISVKDEKKYCEQCFEKINKQLSFKKIKYILNSTDETYGLSTSKKIEFILVKNIGNKLSACQIYDIGEPWDLKTFTPRNSVYARISSLYKIGAIKRQGTLYFI